MRRNERECRQYKCSQPLYLGGLCEKHHEESVAEDCRRSAALDALFTGLVGGCSPNDPGLRDELARLQGWWHRVCNSVNYGREDEVLREEAHAAVEWCVALSKEIVAAELTLRKGGTVSLSLHATREWVWHRFSSLEAGLMSNGVKRRQERA